nr:conjugal transfer pilus assembly protein TraH [Klebsiella pneumoniae]
MLCVMEDRMRIKLLSLFCGAALGLSFSAAADVNGDMNNFFNKLGFASNTSQPQVWQGGRRRVMPLAVRCMPERR